MFSHRTWEEQLIYHELQNENSMLRLVPSRGGIITEWMVEDEPVLYLDKATLLNPTQNIRGGIPILFPICGPLRAGQYSWAGTNYQMKQHGLVRNMPWQVSKLELAAEEARITLETVSTTETKKIYPFDFHLIFTYQFRGNSLTIQQSYHNTSQTGGADEHKKMPFYAGFHPYFYATKRDAIKLNIPAQKCMDILSGSTLEVMDQLNVAGVAEANYVFSGLSRNRAEISNLGTGRKVIIEFADEFRHIVLWALAGQDFFCFEPWMGNNYALNSGQDLTLLDPGQHLDTWVTISVQD